MSSLKMIDFAGTISKVSEDGISATVRLDEPVEGRIFAVISPETNGKSNSNGSNFVRRLHPGQEVSGSARRGPGALKAVTVTLKTHTPKAGSTVSVRTK